MRLGADWKDVYFLNISSRGLLVQARSAPPQGSFIEFRRGSHVVVARVVWSQEMTFGVLAQDVIPVDAIIQDKPPAADSKGGSAQVSQERRAVPRQPSAAERHERSRYRARAMEFTMLAAAGAALAGGAFSMVHAAIADPMAELGSVLGGK